MIPPRTSITFPQEKIKFLISKDYKILSIEKATNKVAIFLIDPVHD